jgi:hypothetical protein
VPEYEFVDMERYDILFNENSEEGMGDIKLLKLTSNLLSVVNCPISEGIVPFKKFLCNCTLANFVDGSPEGILPVIEFEKMPRKVKDDIAPNPLGIDLTMRLLLRLMDAKLLREQIVVGILPVRLFTLIQKYVRADAEAI